MTMRLPVPARCRSLAPMAAKSSTTADRRRRALRRFMASRNLQVFPWAKRAGVSEAAIRNFLKGRSDSLAVPILEKLAAAEGVPIDALVTMPSGELILLEMKTRAMKSPKTGANVGARKPATREEPPASAAETEPFAIVAELDVRAAAGPNGSAIEILHEREDEAVVARYGFPREGFRQLFGAAPERVRIVEVIGDSMAPTLLPGQRVLVDTNDVRPSPPGIFVVWDGMGLVLKRVEFVPHSDPPTVRILSDNARYPAYERPVGEAWIQGRVIGGWLRL